ncbi:radical SAM protein [Patescibacteria group bacterium]|nr:radical SAM protein [Patescibacteria group bacterium]
MSKEGCPHNCEVPANVEKVSEVGRGGSDELRIIKSSNSELNLVLDGLNSPFPHALLEFSKTLYRDDVTFDEVQRQFEKENFELDKKKYPYSSVMLNTVFLDQEGWLKLDCTMIQYRYKAGDIVKCKNEHSKHYGKYLFVEGFLYRSLSCSTLVYFSVLDSSGNVEKQLCEGWSIGAFEEECELVHRWGEYDPEEFGVDISKRDNVFAIDTVKGERRSSEDGMIRVTNSEFVENFFEARNFNKISAEDEPFKLENVFDEYVEMLMRVEFKDLLQRLNHIFPLKNYDRIIEKVDLCKTSVEIQDYNHVFFAGLKENFKDDYSDEQLSKIADYLREQRERFDLEKLLRESCTYMRTSAEHKIGGNLRHVEVPRENIIEKFPDFVNDLVLNVAKYLVPLFGRNEDYYMNPDLFRKRSTYFSNLLGDYANPLDAARHVVGVGFNGVSEMFDRAMNREFKYFVNGKPAFEKPEEQEAYYELFFADKKTELRAHVSDAMSLIREIFDEFDVTALIMKEVYGENGFEIRSDMSFSDVNNKLSTINKNLAQAFSGLKKKFFDRAGSVFDKIDPELKNSFSGIFDAMVDSFFANCGINDEIIKTVHGIFDQFLKNSGMDVCVVEEPKTYPIRTLEFDGELVDCQSEKGGFKGGDIISINNRGSIKKYLVEGIGVKNGRVYIRDLTFGVTAKTVDYFELKDFENDDPRYKVELLARWGNYDPADYSYGLLNRVENSKPVYEGVLGGYDYTFLMDDFMGKLLGPLRKMEVEFNDHDHRIDNKFGEYICEHIIRDIKYTEGKALLPTRLLYFDRDIYSVYPAAPPSSSGSNVIRFEISTGCSHGKCSYCNLYENEDYSLKNFEDFEKHFDLIWEYLGARVMKKQFKRVFLSGGNGLSMKTDDLCKILKYARKNLGVLRRIESYANTLAIKKHGEEGLKRLKESGLNMVYWGVESCNDGVLKLSRKGYRSKSVSQAGKMLNDAGIGMSITVMPGLGGEKFSERHAEDTGKILGELAPEFLTLMSVHAPGSLWEQDMNDDMDNRALNENELKEEILLMRKVFLQTAKKNPNGFKRKVSIAAHGPNITPVSNNPTSFQTRIELEKK